MERLIPWHYSLFVYVTIVSVLPLYVHLSPADRFMVTLYFAVFNRNEVIKLALDILFNISVSSKLQMVFCQNVSLRTDESQSGIRYNLQHIFE